MQRGGAVRTYLKHIVKGCVAELSSSAVPVLQTRS